MNTLNWIFTGLIALLLIPYIIKVWKPIKKFLTTNKTQNKLREEINQLRIDIIEIMALHDKLKHPPQSTAKEEIQKDYTAVNDRSCKVCKKSFDETRRLEGYYIVPKLYCSVKCYKKSCKVRMKAWYQSNKKEEIKKSVARRKIRLAKKKETKEINNNLDKKLFKKIKGARVSSNRVYPNPPTIVINTLDDLKKMNNFLYKKQIDILKNEL